jgi:hypothetical protein
VSLTYKYAPEHNLLPKVIKYRKYCLTHPKKTSVHHIEQTGLD